MKLIILFFLTFYTLYANDNCEDTLFTFNISQSNSNVRIIDILENVAHECKFSVKIKDKEAKKLLYKNLYLVHIKDYSLSQILDFLFRQNNMFHQYDERMRLLTVSYLQTHSFIIDYVNLSEHSTESVKNISVGASATAGGGTTGEATGTTTSSSGNSDTTTITTRSQFQFWDKLSQEIDSILSRDNDAMKIKSKSIINREAGVVTITGTKNQIDRINKYLTKIKDRLHKQVQLETTLLEYTSIDSENSGVDWSKFNLSLKGNTGKLFDSSGATSGTAFAYDFSMEGLIDFLNKDGKVDVLSTPKITTLNNRAAVINVGQQINYRYQSGSRAYDGATSLSSTYNTYVMSSVFIGLTLNIVPEITDDGYIVLQINPVVSEKIDPSSDLNAADNGSIVDSDGVRIMPPDIRIKQLSSIVKVKDRGKVIVGGLMSTVERDTSSKVPLLGDIPGIGWLFKSKSKSKYKTELIIIITPKLIKNNSFPSIDSIENSLEGLSYE